MFWWTLKQLMSQGDVLIPACGLVNVVFFIWNYSNELCCDNSYKRTCSRKTLHTYPINCRLHYNVYGSIGHLFISTPLLCSIYGMFTYSCATDSIIVYLLFYRMDTLHSFWQVRMVTQALWMFFCEMEQITV